MFTFGGLPREAGPHHVQTRASGLLPIALVGATLSTALRSAAWFGGIPRLKFLVMHFLTLALRFLRKRSHISRLFDASVYFSHNVHLRVYLHDCSWRTDA
jgi:hypothetical protein